MAQNGASLPEFDLVCFYSLKVSGLRSKHHHHPAAAGALADSQQHSAAMCYHTVQQRWHAFGCTVPHDGGQVVAVGPHLLVAGGFDPASSNSTTTATIDVLTFSSTAGNY